MAFDERSSHRNNRREQEFLENRQSKHMHQKSLPQEIGFQCLVRVFLTPGGMTHEILETCFPSVLPRVCSDFLRMMENKNSRRILTDKHGGDDSAPRISSSSMIQNTA
jgi:hypothetical protein